MGKMAEVFDCAGGVVVHEDAGLISVWNGSATVNVYTGTGACVDCWTQYDMDAQAFRSAAIAHIEGD